MGKLDVYKILRVSHSATIEEIKTSYRKLALEMHPDRHQGCSKKMEEFKQLNEAYSILMDSHKRTQYDRDYYKHIRKTAPPPNYRKVYAPSPPPDWEFVWNHREHYEMHYGDGFAKKAFEQLKKSAEKDGDFEYKSPLGKGFSFSTDFDHNPFSKASPQGPPKVRFEYEEVYVDMDTGRQNRQETIVKEMHSRRKQRLQRDMKDPSSSSSSQPKYTRAAHAVYSARQQQQQHQAGDCVIL